MVKQSKDERKFEKFVEIIMSKPEFQEVYARHQKAAVKATILELHTHLSEGELAVIMEA